MGEQVDDDPKKEETAAAEGDETPESPVDDTDANSDEVVLVDVDPLTQAQNDIQVLEARLRTVSAAYQEQRQEVEATKERIERQATFQRQFQRGELVAALFEPLDNLKRCIDGLEVKAVGEDTQQGLVMVVQQFMDAFEKLGLEEIPGKGAVFDPQLHEALSVLPVSESAQDGLIIEVFSAGYRIGNRLLKPARVVIGKAEELAAEE